MISEIRIKKSTLLLLLYIFPFLPIMLLQTTLYYNVQLILKITLGLLGIVSIVFLNKKNYKYLFLFFLWEISFILPELLHGVLHLKSIILELYPIGFFCTILYWSQKDKKKLAFVLYFWSKFIIWLYYMFLMINIILGKTNGSILYDNRNAIQTYLTLAIGCSLFYSETVKNKNVSRYIFLAFLGILLSRSATGILSAIIGIIVYKFYKHISLKKISIIYLISFFIIIVFNLTNLQIVKLILKVFKKNVTFTSRLWRWQFSLNLMKTNFIFGNMDLERKASNYAGYYIDYFNPHNALLYILLFGGILSAILLFLLMYQVKNIKNRYFLVVISMIFTTGLMESNVNPTSFVFVLFLILAISEKERGVSKCEKNITIL